MYDPKLKTASRQEHGKRAAGKSSGLDELEVAYYTGGGEEDEEMLLEFREMLIRTGDTRRDWTDEMLINDLKSSAKYDRSRR